MNVSIPGGGEEHRVIFRGKAMNGGRDNGGGVNKEGDISIISVTSQGGGQGQGGGPPGQSINVEFTVNTTATDAEVRVESWSGLTLRDSITVKVAAQQPQTVSVSGRNQANRIEAILYELLEGVNPNYTVTSY
ncbi:hypothetical protein [Halohasta litorea]|uniref:Uncharacterized protein n=1 Tax=Halohasta litorea TaxID=869891 RepID=A0ABD6DBM7_9EURY|nr:hypothetical protein [Halohasta litorea]